MRIIKLSTQFFNTFKDVQNHFEKTLPEEKGRFRITKKRIAEEEFAEGEKLVFSYEGILCYLAISTTGIRKNDDNYASELPYCFYVDLNSITPLITTIHEFEYEYHNISQDNKSIVQSEGWPHIKDVKTSELLWIKLITRTIKRRPIELV